jgi:hypothetical protein
MDSIPDTAPRWVGTQLQGEILWLVDSDHDYKYDEIAIEPLRCNLRQFLQCGLRPNTDNAED